MVNVSKKTNIVVKAALLLTLGFILTYFEFPILPAFPWLKVDLSAVPVLLAGFAFGPLIGFGVEVLKNVLQIVIQGSTSGGVGQLANIIVVGSYVIVASLAFKKLKTRKGAILGAFLGSLVMIPLAMLANYFILIPMYFPGGLEADFFRSYMFYGIPVFNFIKGAIISGVGILFYDRVATLINREAMFQERYKKLHKAS
jgi:riboflavin transporter FmnP